jgi:SNF2 family DNA or RNA helicase
MKVSALISLLESGKEELNGTGHFIRNVNSRMARAVCSIDAISRWAVTGTPIQNRLGDLAALLKFIRVHPYDDLKRFDTDISQLWKSGEDEEAVKRLKRLSACLLLRRAKGTVQLPPRHDLQCPVDFTREERSVYEKMRDQVITKVDEALHRNSETSRVGAYVNVLQQIESLRLFCDLGLTYNSRHSNPGQSLPESSDWNNIAQQTFNVQREMGPITCLQCSSVLDITESVYDDNTTPQISPLYSECLRFICGECVRKLHRSRSSTSCGHTPPCSLVTISTSNNLLEDVSNQIISQCQPENSLLPSKVEALLSDLSTLPMTDKWYRLI